MPRYSNDTWVSPIVGCRTGCSECIALRTADKAFKTYHPSLIRHKNDSFCSWTGDIYETGSWEKKLRKAELDSSTDRIIINYYGDIGFCPTELWRNKVYPSIQSCNKPVVLITKQPWRLANLMKDVPEPKTHVSVAVSVTNQISMMRVRAMRENLSCFQKMMVWFKPLTDEIVLNDGDLDNISQVEIAGMLGSKALRISIHHLYSITRHCETHSIPYYFDHGGGHLRLKYSVRYSEYQKYRGMTREEMIEEDRWMLPGGYSIWKKSEYQEIMDCFRHEGSIHYTETSAKNLQWFKNRGLVKRIGGGRWKRA